MSTPAPRGARAARSGPRRITLLGATGSIGRSAADIVQQQPERFVVEAVTANGNAEALAETAKSLGARLAVVADPAAYDDLVAALAGSGIEAAAGAAAVVEAAARPADLVVAGLVGSIGLAPTLAAIEAGADIALANKECLVCAGGLFLAAAERAGVHILPVDSEHNAVFQALDAENCGAVERIVLTASGGPFRTWTHEQMRRATAAEALRHPNWSMGRKISIDSATLMNKGLEVIEAHHLFAAPAEQLEVLVHPQSVVHGMVVYADGSVVAQLGAADMRIPIAHCLAWPERVAVATPRLDLTAVGTLTFEKPDSDRFPSLALAYEALRAGDWATTVLNAANEVAVEAFLDGAIGFLDIASVVRDGLDRAAGARVENGATIADTLALDAAARRYAAEAARRRTVLVG
ncbi:1-deoxy-D-xylulose-5-phosphate reductoisomerase [Prosthecomicrobium pneumaticum]|uniref:1-deoxy-D-xylulose-5-phosphate reductoisomerase n=1 Tax=Prosthecomicrobium pneumaticum TaxID=81895 RepID=UPI003CCE1F10